MIIVITYWPLGKLNPLANDILDLNVEAPEDKTAIETIPVTVMSLVLLVFVTVLITSAITFFPTFFGTRAALLQKAKNKETVIEKPSAEAEKPSESDETGEQPVDKAEDNENSNKEETE